jgi:hypothetical protein
MPLDPLPSTVAPFEWSVMHLVEGDGAGSRWTSNWAAAWELLELQRTYLSDYGLELIELSKIRGAEQPMEWAPLVDLTLGTIYTDGWYRDKTYSPERSVDSIASGSSSLRLSRGTALRFVVARPDHMWEGMGDFVWSVVGSDVPYLRTAMEGRWGGAALLADALIVPHEHPWVGDEARADELVRGLQTVVTTFRQENRL